MSHYYIRYAARCRYDGGSTVLSADTKAMLSEVVNQERRYCREYNTHFEVEERFPALYWRDKNGVVTWVGDIAHIKIARKIVKLLNGE